MPYKLRLKSGLGLDTKFRPRKKAFKFAFLPNPEIITVHYCLLSVDSLHSHLMNFMRSTCARYIWSAVFKKSSIKRNSIALFLHILTLFLVTPSFRVKWNAGYVLDNLADVSLNCLNNLKRTTTHL